MKLVEKKCPNCGAGLTFGPDDREVKCEYCNKAYIIEFDRKKSQTLDDEHLGDAYEFLNEYGKPIAAGVTFAFSSMAIFSFIVIALFIVFAVFLFFKITDSFDSNNSDDVKEVISEEVQKENTDNLENINYIKSLDEIDDAILNTLSSLSKEKLNGFDLDNKDYKVGAWERKGLYLLVNDSGNYVIDVFSHRYSARNSSKKVDLYCAVLYKDINNEDKIEVYGYKAPDIDLDNEQLNFAWGYKSVEELYTEVIKYDYKGYEVYSTNNLYVE